MATYRPYARYNPMHKYTQRTILKVLSAPTVNKPYVAILDGKLHSGDDSQHLSKSGRQFNKLLRLAQQRGVDTQLFQR